MLGAYKIRERILAYERDYPEFPFLTSMNEVAMTYGWGNAITAWENYTSLKELLVAP